MDKQYKLDTAFINIAQEIAKLSYCIRAKVGAIIVKDGNIVSMSYNGTFSGTDNCCEDKDYTDAGGWLDEDIILEKWPFEDNIGRYRLITKKEVMHAETGAIIKAAKVGLSTDGATMYLTLSPCIECAKLILQAGIKRIVYLTKHSNLEGIKFLEKFIKIDQYV